MTQPAVAEGLLTWSPEHGLAPGKTEGGRLLVADSWLLRDGRVRGFDRHRERFVRSCGECGAPNARYMKLGLPAALVGDHAMARSTRPSVR